MEKQEFIKKIINELLVVLDGNFSIEETDVVKVNDTHLKGIVARRKGDAIAANGPFENFCKKENITVLNFKKAKFSKQEIDEAITIWIKNGNGIPERQKDLTALGLPSSAAIMKYYENWREPFEVFLKMYEKMF